MYHILKLNRKSLILAVPCFVLALVTFGIVILAYFLCTQSASVFSINPEPLTTLSHNNAVRNEGNHEHLDKNENLNNIRTFSKIKPVTENDIKSRSFVLDKSKHEGYVEYFQHYDNKRDRLNDKYVTKGNPQSHTIQNGVVASTGNSVLNSGAKQNDEKYESKLVNNANINSNTETIYIDDYDRLWDSIGITASPSTFNSISNQLDMNSVEYFESSKDDFARQAKSLLYKVSSLSSPSFVDKSAKISSSSPATHAENNGRLRKTSQSRTSAGTSLSGFYRASAKKNKSFQSKRKRILSQALAYQRHRYMLADDDDTYRSDEIFDNDSIGSGSGDFVDQKSKHNTIIDDSDVYVAATGTDFEQYRIQSNRHENFYSIKDVANFTILNSRIEDSVVANNSAAPNFPSYHASNGSHLQKWMPPSIVSNLESRLAIPARSHLSALRFVSVKPTTALAENSHIDNESMLITVNQKQRGQQLDYHLNSGAWLETRARRIMGNVKKSEERSRQLLLCAEAGGGELCRMLFKGHIGE